MKEAEAIYPAALGAVRSDARAPTTATTSSGTSTTAVKAPPPRIRPLSESKAIDAGANFISESFLVAVAATMVLLEALRSRRKEARNKDTVAERLELLESQNRQDIIRLEQLEEAAILTGERVMDLEEQVWRLQGGKGEFRARGSGVDVKAWTPLPLWEPPVKAAGNIWSNIVDLGQNFGGKKVVDDKAVVAMANAKN